ncbi:hypothetical protein PR048_021420 [Dryococelus australis]|uniref:Uncharacterized protein n=1 Tax=Dryococelus australis TaxID=614101 RepID=A0ABQ9GYB6_9NEOP|nr:hypothetical protein PR048_021420 [Dryococelus australis]
MVKFVFDNADVNVRTLTELGTFHSLGGLNCVPPSTAVNTTSAFLSDKYATVDSKQSNQIPIVSYKKPTTLTLGLLWATGYINSDNIPPFWNGYMQPALCQTGSMVTQTIPLHSSVSVLLIRRLCILL